MMLLLDVYPRGNSIRGEKSSLRIDPLDIDTDTHRLISSTESSCQGYSSTCQGYIFFHRVLVPRNSSRKTMSAFLRKDKDKEFHHWPSAFDRRSILADLETDILDLIPFLQTPLACVPDCFLPYLQDEVSPNCPVETLLAETGKTRPLHLPWVLTQQILRNTQGKAVEAVFGPYRDGLGGMVHGMVGVNWGAGDSVLAEGEAFAAGASFFAAGASRTPAGGSADLLVTGAPRRTPGVRDSVDDQIRTADLLVSGVSLENLALEVRGKIKPPWCKTGGGTRGNSCTLSQLRPSLQRKVLRVFGGFPFENRDLRAVQRHLLDVVAGDVDREDSGLHLQFLWDWAERAGAALAKVAVDGAAFVADEEDGQVGSRECFVHGRIVTIFRWARPRENEKPPAFFENRWVFGGSGWVVLSMSAMDVILCEHLSILIY